MTRLQLGRRVAAAVIAVLVASPLRGARAQGQARDDRGPAVGQREGGSPDPAAGRPSATIWARNEREFAQALQSGADESWVPMFDPRTQVALTRTITVRQTRNDGTVWGANGNFAKVRWAGPAGHDMIVYRGVKGVNNRGLHLEKFSLSGNAEHGAACGACLKLHAPDGDAGCLYKFTLRDIHTASGTYGIVLQGAVFEGMCENVHGENHLKDGMFMEHTNPGRADRGIVSNIQLIHPNMSRNLGAGVRSVYSCNAAFGSFVLNAEGGIVAPDGLRVGAFNNGENTGEAVYVVPANGYGSSIIYSEGSTDGSTHARKFENGQWISVGKPMMYLLSRGAGVSETGNHVATYGGAAGSPLVRVVK
jgi:hypothetical protein